MLTVRAVVAATPANSAVTLRYEPGTTASADDTHEAQLTRPDASTAVLSATASDGEVFVDVPAAEITDAGIYFVRFRVNGGAWSSHAVPLFVTANPI